MDEQRIENPFAQYPIYLKYTDIMDMFQIGKNKAYDLMKQSRLSPKAFGAGTLRVPRDKFIRWVLDQEAEARGA